MKNKITFISFIFFLTGSLFNLFAMDRGGRGYFSLGGNRITLDEINLNLNNYGYSDFSEDFINIGIGGHGIINRIIIGGDGGWLIGSDAQSDSFKARISGGYGFFDIGHFIYVSNVVRIYPVFGLGVGVMNLKVSGNETVPSFNDILNDPRRSVELSNVFLLLKVSLAGEYHFTIGGGESGIEGLFLGLCAGYLFSPVKSEWRIDEVGVIEGPEFGVEGPYVSLIFGGWGFGKK